MMGVDFIILTTIFYIETKAKIIRKDKKANSNYMRSTKINFKIKIHIS